MVGICNANSEAVVPMADNIVSFEILKRVKLRYTIFRDKMPCSLIEICQTSQDPAAGVLQLQKTLT